MTDKIVVLTSLDSEAGARALARSLVESKLAACVQIHAASSLYRWQQKVAEAAEHVLVIKTRRDLFPALRDEIAKLHSYELPEVIALPVVDGSEAYLSWMDRETAQ